MFMKINIFSSLDVIKFYNLLFHLGSISRNDRQTCFWRRTVAKSQRSNKSSIIIFENKIDLF